MEKFKHNWARLPRSIRKPVVLVAGSIFIIASGLLGWLPGPGGIPLFLIGIAILSTEFEWAQQLRDWVLAKIKRFGDWWRGHKLVGSVAFVLFTAAFIGIGVLFYQEIKPKLHL